ncbi:MAG: RelA/SpoT family protein [Actinomycetes bacterium]
MLPWKRHNQPPQAEVALIVDAFKRYHPRRSTDLITESFSVARAAHEGQLRNSGEPYITHPVAVAAIVAQYGMDDVSIAAALLHDAVEDTKLTTEELEGKFGSEVAAIVDGVTKLDRVHFDSREEQQAATMRRMLVAMAKDVRVLILKLADRLHNMRTIAAMPAWKQERTAIETLDIYAPLAHRLGMQQLRQQMEDLCFASLHPKLYAEIDSMVADRDPERDVYVDRVIGAIRERIAEMSVTAEVTGRPKHLWSIYEKMVRRNKAFGEIYDLIGIRIVVDSISDCYATLGSIHALWTPVPGRFKDYVANPKVNGYQSLHTTVIGLDGYPVEVQIRTREMHSKAEWGVAAHFLYKEGPSEDVAWLTRIVDWQQEMTDPAEFMASLKTDLEFDEVFVFTPKGDVVTLPVGATPIDFAYAIHTEVGHRCIGARVAGRLVPLDHQLSSGDTVEIFTSKVPGHGPSRDWEHIAVTRAAQSRIRQWFSRERREDSVENGRDDLVRAMRRQDLPVQRLIGSPLIAEVAASLKYQSADALFAAIGEHHVSAESVASRVARTVRGASDAREEVVAAPSRPRGHRRNQPVGVHVEGFDDMLVRMARCCTPVPGDNIMGFVTRGRGVSVHRVDCANSASLAAAQKERIVDVYWDESAQGHFVAMVEVRALDRPRLLGDVTSMLADYHVNILSSQSQCGPDKVSRMRFEFELGEAEHLDLLLHRLRTIDSVYDAYRVVPGART